MGRIIQSAFGAGLYVLAVLSITALPTNHASAADGPFIVAHRGASGYLPEHTLEAVAMAHQMGAHFIEQDVVLTRDNVPVILHDIHLETVTDVETKFPDRKRPDGRFYAIDFDLAEIKTLNVHERVRAKDGKPAFPGRFPQGVGTFRVPTLMEEIELIQGLNHSTGRKVGIFPEIKAPEFHHAAGKDLSRIVIDVLARYGYRDKSDHVFIQSFDWPETQRIRAKLGYAGRLVQLLGENKWKIAENTDYDVLKTPAGLAAIAKVADAISPWVGQIAGDLRAAAPAFTDLDKNAKAAGLLVVPYTFRADRMPKWATSFDGLIKQIIIDRDLDGLFTDFPDKAAAALAR